ncbi:MAG: histidine kinase [Microscillaceae bacterium]|jgi:signal transduction histidine kinase|nr:histidine kinase [Microscillaceae bacterium]
MNKLFFLVIFTLYFFSNLYAQSLDNQGDTFIMPPHFKKIYIENDIWILDDKAGKKDLKEIYKNVHQWYKTPSAIPSFGRGSGYHWLKFKIKNPHKSLIHSTLEYIQPFTHTFEIYIFNQKNELYLKNSFLGWQTIQNHPREYIYPTQAIDLQPLSQYTVYIKFYSPFLTLKAPLILWEQKAFARQFAEILLFWGVFSGLMGLVGVFSFFLFLTNFERIYFYYTCYVFCLWLMMIEGDAVLYYLLPQYAYFWTGWQVMLLASSLVMIFTLKFAQYFLQFPSPAVYRLHFLVNLLIISLLLVWLPFLLEFWTDDESRLWALHIFNFLSFLTGLLLVTYIVFSIALRFVPGYIHALALLPMLGLAIAMILTNFKVLPTYRIYWYGAPMAAIFEVLVLSAGLAYRFKTYRDEKNAQQKLAYEARLQADEEKQKRMTAQLQLQAEKERISLDLHDNIGSHLTYLTSSMDFLAHQFGKQNPDLPEKLEALSDSTRETMQELRNTIWVLNRESIDFQAFIQRLKNYLNSRFEADEWHFQNDLCDKVLSQQLTAEQVLHLFRWAQEALQNIKKHAQATHIQFAIQMIDSYHIQFKIQDNGKGFDLNTAQVGHFGLENMQKRAKLLGGTLQINSNIGGGTEVNLLFPLTMTQVLS